MPDSSLAIRAILSFIIRPPFKIYLLPNCYTLSVFIIAYNLIIELCELNKELYMKMQKSIFFVKKEQRTIDIFRKLPKSQITNSKIGADKCQCDLLLMGDFVMECAKMSKSKIRLNKSNEYKKWERKYNNLASVKRLLDFNWSRVFQKGEEIMEKTVNKGKVKVSKYPLLLYLC